MACVLALLHGGALTFFVAVCHRKGEREGKCRDEEEMERTSRWEKSDLCGTACALHPHPAAHGMPARCAVGDGHLAACPPAVHGCSASFRLALPLLHMMVVVEEDEEEERERGQPCASRTISTQMCALNAEWGMQQGVAHTRTHAVGGHPSFHTTARRRGAATDMASLCGGVGHWQACKAWWPWSAAQLLSMDSTCAKPREERE